MQLSLTQLLIVSSLFLQARALNLQPTSTDTEEEKQPFQTDEIENGLELTALTVDITTTSSSLPEDSNDVTQQDDENSPLNSPTNALGDNSFGPVVSVSVSDE